MGAELGAPQGAPQQLDREAHTAGIGPDDGGRATGRLAASALTDGGRVHVDRWLRQDRLVEEFLGFISEFTDVGDQDRRRSSSWGA